MVSRRQARSSPSRTSASTAHCRPWAYSRVPPVQEGEVTALVVGVRRHFGEAGVAVAQEHRAGPVQRRDGQADLVEAGGVGGGGGGGLGVDEGDLDDPAPAAVSYGGAQEDLLVVRVGAAPRRRYRPASGRHRRARRRGTGNEVGVASHAFPFAAEGRRAPTVRVAVGTRPAAARKVETRGLPYDGCRSHGRWTS